DRRTGEWALYTNRIIAGNGKKLLALWKNNKFASAPTTLFPDKVTNLHGTKLKVITFQWEPSVMYKLDEDGAVVYRYGRDVMVVQALAEALNATLAFEDVPKEEAFSPSDIIFAYPGEMWGLPDVNGSWNGLMGSLQRGEADVGLANLFITNVNNRTAAVDFSAPFDTEVSCFLTRLPKPLPQWERILYPFDFTIWLIFLIGLLLSGPFLTFLARGGFRCDKKENLQDFTYSSLYTFAIHFRVSQSYQPTQRGTNILVTFLWIYAFIITIAYSSNLTAFLTVTRRPPTIDTIQDLYESKLEVGGMGIFFGSALASSKNPYLKGLADKYKGYNSYPGIVSKVKEGSAVYIGGKRFLQYMAGTYFSQRGVSSVRLIKDTFSPYGIAVATPRKSPLRRKFNDVISRIVEAGLVNYWAMDSLRIAKQEADTKRLTEKDEVCKTSMDTQCEEVNAVASESYESELLKVIQGSVSSLNLKHMQGIFYMYAIGIWAALLVFLLEKITGG
ncbi:hypothetical protein SK128_013601, partial [Halocaridina rubra]